MQSTLIRLCNQRVFNGCAIHPRKFWFDVSENRQGLERKAEPSKKIRIYGAEVRVYSAEPNIFADNDDGSVCLCGKINKSHSFLRKNDVFLLTTDVHQPTTSEQVILRMLSAQ